MFHASRQDAKTQRILFEKALRLCAVAVSHGKRDG
jgi:hypothetical protein